MTRCVTVDMSLKFLSHYHRYVIKFHQMIWVRIDKPKVSVSSRLSKVDSIENALYCTIALVNNTFVK